VLVTFHRGASLTAARSQFKAFCHSPPFAVLPLSRGEPIADRWGRDTRRCCELAAVMSSQTHHPDLSRNQQQHAKQTNPVPQHPNLSCALVRLHAATLARRHRRVLIDKPCGNIALADGRLARAYSCISTTSRSRRGSVLCTCCPSNRLWPQSRANFMRSGRSR
jgi:hypothetical protein